MALAVIIFLVAIISAVGLAFLYRVGALTASSTGHGSGMQAEYLAESAANHAIWRLLNEPGFPDKEDVYYMHSLGSGRYGYKVRKPTATTFAAVATVGGVTALIGIAGVTYGAPVNRAMARDPDDHRLDDAMAEMLADWIEKRSADGSGG